MDCPICKLHNEATKKPRPLIKDYTKTVVSTKKG